MPQWRKLHVKTIDSLDINAMPDDFTRMMWLLLPLGLDREGRGVDDSSWIKSKLFPLRRDVTYEQVNDAMCWYAQRGMIERYEVDGRRYFYASKFREYQGKTDREADSKIPAPVQNKTKKGLVKVKTIARPLQESCEQRSMTDVEVDTEVEVEKHTGAKTAPDAPDPLKELSTVFEKASGIKIDSIPKKQQGAMWWNPLRLMLKTANSSAPDEVKASVTELRQRGLTVSGPNSILKTFNSIHGKHVAPGNGNEATAQLRALGYTDANGKPI
jgi:hypothetical protein